MDLAVADAARVLDVDESRVRRLLRDGVLTGRKLGGMWLVDGDEAALLAGRRAPSGRPFAPARAWGVLDVLDGGRAPWLDASSGSRVRAMVRDLAGSPPGRWRASLRSRSRSVRCFAHPAAVDRLRDAPGVVVAGPARAVAAGADLVVINDRPEVYVQADEWDGLAARFAIEEVSSSANLWVRVPRGVWPFGDDGQQQRAGLAVLAADLLDSPEPRSESAGVAALNGLAARFSERRGRAS